VATDPNFSSVALLLHCDDASGSATFANAASGGAVAIGQYGAVTSATNPKFGAGSLDTTAGGYAQGSVTGLPAASGDFTFELWFYALGNGNLFDFRDSSGGVLYLDDSSFGMYSPGGIYASTARPANGAWNHAAVVRSAGTISVYLNGVWMFSGGDTVPMGASCLLGNNFPGYLDEVRYTPGVARYTANFAPPTAAYPDGSSGGGGAGQTAALPGLPAATEQKDTASGSAKTSTAGAIAGTETKDAASGAASTATTGSLAATEQQDTVNASATTGGGASLAATEQRDSASGTAATATTAALTANEGKDTASATAQQGSNYLAATEQSDTAQVAASTRTTAALAGVEAADTASTSAISGTTAAVSTTEASDASAAAAATSTSASLVAMEQPDALTAAGGVAPQAALAATEARDAAAVTAVSGIQSTAVLAVTERPDTASVSAILVPRVDVVLRAQRSVQPRIVASRAATVRLTASRTTQIRLTASRAA
jgi:hypothetical protein